MTRTESPDLTLCNGEGISRRSFLDGLAATAAAGMIPATLAQSARRPNFVFILADDLGWTDTGVYGSSFYETPHVDRLATQGMRFTNYYSACPVCSPTRASIMTGKYPARLHLTNFIPGSHRLPYSPVLPPSFRQELPLEEVTLAEALRPAGYATAAIGKWHLGGAGFEPKDQGFDEGYDVRRGDGSSRFFNPGWVGHSGTPGKTGDYLPDHLTGRALNFLESNKSKPFLLYLAFHVPHIPIEGKKEHTERFRPKVKAGARPGKDHQNPEYAAMIYSMDENIGRVMKKLDELKLAGDTIVMFTSDNGGLTAPEFRNTPTTSNLPLREGKGHVYEGGIRDPFIVRWPGKVRAGSVCDAPVSSIDHFPTLMDLAGARYDYKSRPVDGVSITSLFRQAGSPAARNLYWHYPHYSNQLGRPGGAVRQGDLKLIQFYDDDSIELYNLKDDPGEHSNLARKMPAKAAELKKVFANWLDSTKAQRMTKNPNHDPARADLRVTSAPGSQKKQETKKK